MRMEILLVGSARHLELDGGLRDLEYLMLNLPHTCNYRCLKCCNYDRGESAEKPLSYDEIKELTAEAKDLEMRVLVFAGEGEPLLDDNFYNIVSHANEKELIPYIFTNGSMLDIKTTQFLKNNGASLVVNIDSLKKELYEDLTGVEGSFERIFKNIQEIRGQFKDSHSQINSYELRRVAINTVISRKNQGELS